MSKLSTLFVAAALLAPSAYAAAPALADQIDAALAPMFKPGWPGATVIVTKDGKTVFRKAYGLSNIAEQAAMQPDSLLRVGSVTKQFTAVAILQLAEQGKLSVKDDITRFLPDYPTRGKRITIEHLLHHTSGIPNYTALKAFRDVDDATLDVPKVIGLFKDEPLDFEPGERFSYSNSGYFLLGAIIEKVSGMRYQDYIATHLFEPLGMKDTAHEGFERSAKRRVNGYRLRGGTEIVAVGDINLLAAYAAGAVVSTSDDMARWETAISSGKLLKPATWKQAFTSCKVPKNLPCNYGYGWNIGTLAGHKLFAHGGSIPGFTAQSLRLPDDKVYVAVLTNGNGGAVNTPVIAYKTAAIAIGKPFPDYKPIALAPDALDAFVGEYRSDEQVVRTVKREGDKLVLVRAGRDPVTLQAHAANAFFMDGSLTSIEFQRSADGKVDTMLLRQPLNDEKAVRQ